MNSRFFQDLTTALNETTKNEGTAGRSMARRYHRKRRGKKRRTCSTTKQTGHISEASESSIDDLLKGFYEKVIWQSDSDDLCKSLPQNNSQTVTGMPILSLPESDSVNENFSPSRMHRRKRRPKRMTVDDESMSVGNYATCAAMPGPIYPGKRKRNYQEKTPYEGTMLSTTNLSEMPTEKNNQRLEANNMQCTMTKYVVI